MDTTNVAPLFYRRTPVDQKNKTAQKTQKLSYRIVETQK
jgi:hypothetical protein